MKEPGLDGRYRNLNGQIQQKRSDTHNKNLSIPIPGFAPDTALRIMRKETVKLARAQSEKRLPRTVNPSTTQSVIYLR